MMNKQDKIEFREINITGITQDGSKVNKFETETTLPDNYYCLAVSIIRFDGSTSIAVPCWNNINNNIGVYVYGKITNGTVSLRYTIGKI